jgi:ribosomal peptide maturation radical SAM protein 1
MKVLIVTMPFAGIRPAMGASLLVGHLQRVGMTAKVLYLNMEMAKRLGGRDYDYVANRAPTRSLAGDWVFAQALFGARAAADAAYTAAFRERFFGYATNELALATLARARAQVNSFIDACLHGIDWNSWDVVGFTSSFTQHVASLALSRLIKAAHPHISIVFGGANCEDQMGLALHRNFPFVDFVCSGEADISFPSLVRALSEGADPHGIPGVISRHNGESYTSTLVPDRVHDLDELPYPAFDDYFEQWATHFPNARRPTGILMESSRGCWWGQKHHCTFCGLNGMAMTYRSKSSDRVLKEILDLSSRYDSQHVEMVDNILDMAYFTNILPELAARNLGLGLFYETKANLKKDQLRLMRAAGITAIQPGIESFSTAVLRLMRKGTSAVQNIQLLKWCAEIGIEVHWNLLYGFPSECLEDYEAMAPVLDSITHLEPPRGFTQIRLDRFSPNFVSAGELGLSNVRPDRSYGLIYDLPQDQLFDMAYYFEHDYTDGRDPHQYVRSSERAVRQWMAHHNSHGLVYVDHGERLAVWDFRRAARRSLTILDTLGRLVYLHCDEHRSRNNIEEMVASSGYPGGDLNALLAQFVADKHMVLIDDRYLSLAVPLRTDRPKKPEPVLAV